MCGISGIYAFNELGRFFSIKLHEATQRLRHRGPDFSNTSLHHMVNLGHTRLSIIDLNPESNQPMRDPSGRYSLVFNGEIYNYEELRRELLDLGYVFRTESDTEVLLFGLIHYGAKILERLNGFFAFAFYDEESQNLLLARDRYGIKPLLVYQDEDKILFASEMKSLLAFGIPKEIDPQSLLFYLQLNYIPGPRSILKNVTKLPPGQYWQIKGRAIDKYDYYQLPLPKQNKEGAIPYSEAKQVLEEKLEESVRLRLVADVPLGAFLSGGIDSSVITALASRHVDGLYTFSIGYRDNPFFDETQYANLVAKKYNTRHTVFSLSNRDLFEHLHDMLDYLDEPFADSSALAVYILSQRTRKHVTVALSGDGADELFSGYTKHAAEFRIRNPGFKEKWVEALGPLWKRLPQSRNHYWGNKFRQLHRFAEGARLDPQERYWRWATLSEESAAQDLLLPAWQAQISEMAVRRQLDALLGGISQANRSSPEGFQEILYTDLKLVLPFDMLHKVDSMSMANSLEVRVPFLDHNLVDWVQSLPYQYKINARMRKRILQDTFRGLLPEELYRRPKHGFEVPILGWLRKDLRPWIEGELLDTRTLEEQGIFDPEAVQMLLKQLFSHNPGDVHARIWGLLVFQNWWKKYIQ